MSRARDFADLAGSADAGGLTGRNLIINGAMQVAQRATSVTGVTGDGYQAVDRWRTNSGSLGTFTLSQSTDAPDGFATSHKYDCTTADASPAAGDFLIFEQRVEAQDLQQLNYGASGAESITLSFYVKSNKTGTYIAELALPDASSNSNNQQSYTINSANTWERKTLSYVGNTTDAINNDNGIGMNVFFWLGAGSTYSGGTLTQNTWANTSAANRAAGQVNLADSTSNEWLITGVQLELGEQGTAFEHRSYGDELLRCQRYAVVYSAASSGNETYIGSGTTIDVDDVLVVASLPNNLRATPTVTFTNFGVRTAASYTYNNTINGIFPPVGGNTIGFNIDSADTPYTAGQAVLCVISAGSSNHLTLDAEL